MQRAALELFLRDGLHPLSMEAIAREAHVDKWSIYRRWPSKEALLLDVRAKLMQRPPKPADESTVPSLERAVRSAVRVFSDPILGPILFDSAVDTASTSRVGERLEVEVLRPLHADCAAILTGAIDRGELPPGADVEMLCAMIRGALEDQLLRHQRIDEGFVERLIGFLIGHPDRAPRRAE